MAEGDLSKEKRTFFIWRAAVEGRKWVKYYKSLRWQPALALCCFAEVSLWWKEFQWHRTPAAEVIGFCCRNLVLASESQCVRQFWEQQWPASAPPHALLVRESMLQEWRRGLHWEMHQIRINWNYLLTATMKNLSEGWWAVPDIAVIQDNAYGSLQSNLSLQSNVVLPFPLILECTKSIYEYIVA